MHALIHSTLFVLIVGTLLGTAETAIVVLIDRRQDRKNHYHIVRLWQEEKEKTDA